MNSRSGVDARCRPPHPSYPQDGVHRLLEHGQHVQVAPPLHEPGLADPVLGELLGYRGQARQDLGDPGRGAALAETKPRRAVTQREPLSVGGGEGYQQNSPAPYGTIN